MLAEDDMSETKKQREKSTPINLSHKLIQWWRKQSTNVKAACVIAIVIAGVGIYQVANTMNEQRITAQKKILDETFASYGYEDRWTDVCLSGKDTNYKDANGDTQSIYEGSADKTKFSSTCENLRDEPAAAVTANDIKKMKEIFEKVATLKKERLTQKQKEVRVILEKNGQLEEQKEARRNSFTTTNRDGYTYEVQYTISSEPAVSATIDSSEGKPGYAKVKVKVYVDSWSITNTTKGKKVPCLTGLAVIPLYSAPMISLFNEVKEDGGNGVGYTHKVTLSGKEYTTFNGLVGSSSVSLSTFATQSSDCTLVPDGAVRSTDKKAVTIGNDDGITMREDLAKRFVELSKQPDGYVVMAYDGSSTTQPARLSDTMTIYGEVSKSSDLPIIHIAKGFKQ